jgi:phenylacetate-CoA ligase
MLRTLRGHLELRRNRDLPTAQLRSLQASKLRRLVRHAYERVPFYRDTLDRAGVRPQDIRGVLDVTRLPVIRRQDLQAASLDELLARGFARDECVLRQTGGSTGRPLTIATDPADLEYEAAVWLRTWLRLGLKPRDRQVTIKDPDDAIYADRVRWFQRLGFLRVSYLNIFTPPAELVEALQELAADILRGPPSILEAVAREIDRSGQKLRRQPRLLFTTSEHLRPAARTLLERVFGAPVHDCYGATEAGCIAWRCPRCGSYHVNTDTVLLEVVRGGQPVGDGETGEVVVTNLFARAMPILRYSLGDVCRVERANECRAATEPLAIRDLLGRTTDQIVLPDGRIVSPYWLMPDEVPGIRQYQVIQETLNEVRILVVRGDDFHEDRLEEARRQYQESIGEQCRVRVEYVDVIPPDPAGRLRRVISKVAASANVLF